MFSDDAVELILRPRANWPTHQSGQHLSLTLEINGRLITRVFTIASSAKQVNEDNTLRLLIRTKVTGALTAHLAALKQGERVNISQPYGTFTLPHSRQPLLMLAGGSGITPFIAMLQDIPKGDPRPITLLYYAKPNSHWLVSELAQLQSDLPGFEYQLLDRQRHGDVNALLPPHQGKQWLVCGPHSLYTQAVQLADQTNTPITSEHFSAMPAVNVEATKAEFSLHRDGKRFVVDNQSTLLAHLQAYQQPVTVGCGMGICHQCQCVKKRGVVRDVRTGELSDSGEQLVQLCVSQAVSDVELSA